MRARAGAKAVELTIQIKRVDGILEPPIVCKPRTGLLRRWLPKILRAPRRNKL
jgi:hypothetical protein